MRNKNRWYRERELCGVEDALGVTEARRRFKTAFTRPGAVYLDRVLYKHRVRIDLRNQLPGIYEFLEDLA